MKILLGDGVELNVQRLIETRMLLQANSGGGKSWALRRILEQTHGHVQQIVIDTEDEFYTLREKHDYILVRHEGGDCVPEVRSAELLATRLLELGVSAIISIYELSPRERREFVRRFLTSLVNAPKKLWHRALIVIDEAHEFCPEQGRGSRDESGGCAEAVIGLMAKGRKRGFCGLLATQRLSKLNKDAAAEANNKLIGRAVIINDRKRAAEELGFTSKEEILSLRKLSPGEFFAFGPAISDDVIPLKFGGVQTTHPKAGAAPTPVAPPKHKVQSVLAQLADLPQEAEQERATIADLQKQIRELKSEKAALAKAAPKTETKVETKTIYALKDSQITRIEKLAEKLLDRVIAGSNKFTLAVAGVDKFAKQFGGDVNRCLDFAMQLKAFLQRVREWPEPQAPAAAAAAPPPNLTHTTIRARTEEKARPSTPAPGPLAATGGEGDCSLGKKVERALLTAIAQHPKGLTKQQVLIYADYRRSGDTDQAFRKFVKCGYAIESGDFYTITAGGIDALGPVAPLPSGAALRSQMLGDSRLKKVERELLRVIFEVYPSAISKDAALERASYKRSGDTDQAFRKFVTAGWTLHHGDGFRAVDELFES